MSEPRTSSPAPDPQPRRISGAGAGPLKFDDPRLTADGSRRARVECNDLQTLWFYTGSLCNIECVNCYVESSPSNDSLAYLSTAEVRTFLDEIEGLGLAVREIGFTGGEPFMNPQFLDMARDALDRGFSVLVLTNAMLPMMRPRVQEGLRSLIERHGDRLGIRVSIDHYTPDLHESERGESSWETALSGLHWLAAQGARLSVAARTRWEEDGDAVRTGYAALFERLGLPIDAQDPWQLVLFPEMDESANVPEITVDCWGVLGVSPADMMCASSRMVVKRKGAEAPAVVACTLLPYEAEFELGASLEEALRPVWLNHPHCAKFCVLGGGSCSVKRS